ncbi:unknown [Bacteroides uniformis CAG:3]|nr:unknown [Bacteroides uniformis CAG:3]
MKSLVVLLRTESVYCTWNRCADTYNTLFSGYSSLILVPIALARWVLPTPDAPYRNSGLKIVLAGLRATASATLRDSLLL